MSIRNPIEIATLYSALAEPVKNLLIPFPKADYTLSRISHVKLFISGYCFFSAESESLLIYLGLTLFVSVEKILSLNLSIHAEKA